MKNDPIFMTQKEVLETLRAIGCRISWHSLVNMVESGEIHFIRVWNVSQTGRRAYRIYRKEFEEWLKEVTPHEPR